MIYKQRIGGTEVWIKKEKDVEIRLRLIEIKTFDSGLVQVTYEKL